MFYLVKYYKQIIIIVSLLMTAYGMFFLFSNSKKGMLTIISEYRAMKDRRTIWPFVLAVFLLSCFMLPYGVRFNTSAGIALNYNSASQGLNPNGTRYNQSYILSDEVLERVISKGALKDITVDDLKNTLRVVPIVQGDVRDEKDYFISTQFSVRYEANKDTASLDGQQLLTLVTQAYRECFIEKYSENTSIFKIDFTDLEQQDYLDICEFLRKTAESISTSMNGMASREPAIKSATSGETFQSIASKANSVSTVMIENLEAYVLEDGISKSRADYMSRLSFENVFLHFDALKSAAASRNNLTAISMYEDDMARIVLVPTYDTNNQFYMSQTRIGVDDFARAADSHANNKVTTRSEIATNNHVINMFSAASARNGIDEKAEALIQQIENEIRHLASQAKKLIEEYGIQQANKYMTTSVTTAESQVKSLALRIIVLTIFSAVGFRCFAFVLDENRGKRKRK